MKFYNLAKYDLVQTSIYTFTATLVSGYEAIPNGAVNIPFSIMDSVGNHVRMRASLSGTLFTCTQVFSSTETDNSMPTFSGTFQGTSSNVGEVISKPFINAGVIGTGQSNLPGSNSGKGSLDPLFFVEQDHRIKQVTHNRLGNRDYIEAYAVEPLFHLAGGTVNTMGPLLPFAYELLKEGYHQITLLPFAKSAAAISIYASGQIEYNALKDGTIAWLNDSPNNQVEVWIQMQGETDSGLETDPDTYRDANIQMRIDLAVDVLAATGVDISRVPFIAVGLGPDYIIGQSSSAGATGIRDAIADIPNYMPYSGYVTVPAGVSRNASTNEGGSVDPTHLSAEGQFLLGRTLIMPVVLEARKNFSPIGLGTIINLTAPNCPTIGTTINVHTNEPTVINLTAPNCPTVGVTISVVDDPSATVINLTAPNCPVAGSTIDVVLPLVITDTLATSPTAYFRSDSGVQVSGIDVTQWDDLSGNANHTLPGDGTVTLVADELTFDGASDLIRAALLTFSPRDATIIIELRGSAGTPFQEVVGGNGTRMFTNDIYQIKPGVGTNLKAITSPDIRDGVTRVAAMTLDGSFFKIFHSTGGAAVTETWSQASSAPSFFTGGNGWIGSDGTATSYWTGVIRRLYIKDGAALTEAEINQVIAEF